MTEKFEPGQVVRSEPVGSAPWFVGEVESREGPPGKEVYIIRDYTTRRRWCREASELSLEPSK